MNPNPQDNPTTDEEYASASLIEALRNFPSESAQPCPTIDAAILGSASEKMAEIRSKKIILRNWSFGAIAACLLIGGLSLFFFQTNPNSSHPTQVATKDEAIIYREIGALFSDSLNSVIINESGLQIVLSDKHEMGNRLPVLLEVCESKKCQKIITFVGETIEINGYSIMIHGQTKEQVTIKNDVISNSQNPLPQISIKTISV